MKIEYYEDMLEEEAINKYINMIANDYNGELAKIFKEKYINKNKEIERLHSIIKEVREFIEWHYEDNKNFYKNKGIGLNYPECDYILEILDKEKE